MHGRDSGAFGSALNFCALVRELKQKGFREAPSYENALSAARTMNNQKLVDWMVEQDEHEQFEELLKLHWQTSL